jgi:hypothetical protein
MKEWLVAEVLFANVEEGGHLHLVREDRVELALQIIITYLDGTSSSKLCLQICDLSIQSLHLALVA